MKNSRPRGIDTRRQVVLIGDRFYWTTPNLAYQAALLGGGRLKVWLGRNWRRCRPLVEGPPGSFRLRSGTTDWNLPR